jgi:hypothetical protein
MRYIDGIVPVRCEKGTARIHFRYAGKQLNSVVKVGAERMVAIVEETLIDLERGKPIMPPTRTRRRSS